MSKPILRSAGLMVVAILAGATQQLSATTIYDNSVNDLSLRFNPSTFQVGNQVNFAGTDRALTDFSFEYWGTNTASPGNITFAGSVKAEVRFYLNDGPTFNGYATPGTLFYDSGMFAVGPTPRSTIDFTAGSDWGPGGLFVPADSMTWTVQFSGLTGTDSAGLDLYSPPTVGTDFSDYWENQGAGWELKTNSLSGSMSFGSHFEATVPEPSAISLSILGGLGMLFATRRFRRNQ